jgi:hypothetical protein
MSINHIEHWFVNLLQLVGQCIIYVENQSSIHLKGEIFNH